MAEEQRAEQFKALAHPLRLAILRFVVQGHEEGTPAGELQSRLGIPASTLSHHLDCLASAGLLDVHRQGTFLLQAANFPALKALTDYLWQDCCRGGSCCPSESKPYPL